MKLEITLTDEQAAQMKAALLDAVVPEPTTPAPAFPEPPEGFHKAMMGPLKGVTVACNDDVALFLRASKQWSIGHQGGGKWTYALRIGSEIARLNRLEPEAIPADKEPEPFVFDWSLVPEGRVPAMDSDGQWHHYWTTPSPSSGRKPQWVVASSDQVRDSDRFTKFNHPPFPGDWKDSLQVRPKPDPAKRREFRLFDDGNWNHIGGTSPMDRTTRVREVLPGDPTMEQVEELVRVASDLVECLTHPSHWQRLSRALQPFTGKEQA